MRRKRGTYRPYYGFPKLVLNAPSYVALGYTAKALLIDLRTQYYGSNNGDLHCAWSVMRRERGWNSKETLYYALQELIHAGFVKETRKGIRIGGRHTPSLFALTWERIDRYGGDNCLPTHDFLKPREPWKKPASIKRRARKYKKRRTEAVVANSGSRTWTSAEAVNGGHSDQRNYSGFPSTAQQSSSSDAGHPYTLPGDTESETMVRRYCHFEIRFKEAA